MPADLTTDTGLYMAEKPPDPNRLRTRSVSLSVLVHTAFFCGIIAIGRPENQVSLALVLDLTVALENTVAAKMAESPGSNPTPAQPVAARPAVAAPDNSPPSQEKTSPRLPSRPQKTTRHAIAGTTSKTMAGSQDEPDDQEVGEDRRPTSTDRREEQPATVEAKEVLQPRPNHGITAREGDRPDDAAVHRKSAGDAEPNADGDGVREKSYLQYNFDHIRSLVLRNLSFPAAAKRMGLSGRVLVQFTIQEDGEVVDISILSSSGHDHLDANVVSAIHRSTPFPKPPTRSRLILPIAYRLK